jgi:AraC-like DNA-binding protein
VNECILTNLEDPDLDVEKLARFMNMSKPTLYRKISSLSDFSPNDLINVTRLKRAAELLAEGKYKIYEVAGMVGYASQTNFGRNFLKQFGLTPSDYLAMKEGERGKTKEE